MNPSKISKMLEKYECRFLSGMLASSEQPDHLIKRIIERTECDINLKDFWDTIRDEDIKKLKALDVEFGKMVVSSYDAYLDASSKNLESDHKLYLDAIRSEDEQSKFLRWYGIILTIFAFAYIFLITFIPIPKESIRIADTCLGVIMGNCINVVINFFFGSSVSAPTATKFKKQSDKNNAEH